jgi:hypothetical protein
MNARVLFANPVLLPGALMRRTLILALAFVGGVAVCDARAQSAAPPVELGLDVSAHINRGGLNYGPRLVVNFDDRNSLQFTASLQKLSPWYDAQMKTDWYLATYRRLVHAAGPVRVSTTLGGGLERTVIVTSPITFGDPPVTFPGSRGLELRPAFASGATIDFRLGNRVAMVLESSVVVTEVLSGRFAGGLVVPVGSYRSGPRRLASSVPWAGLDAGERAWVTTGDGREIDGEVVSRSAATLSLRTPTGIASFTADDVRAIDTTDPIRNGTVLGVKIGGIGALGLSIPLTLLFCALEDGCDAGEVLTINGVLIGMGAGVGAAMGALSDSLRERRVPLYRRVGSTGVMLTPIVGTHKLGGRAVIRW